MFKQKNTVIFCFVQKLEPVLELTYRIAARLSAGLSSLLRPHPLPSHGGKANTDSRKKQVKKKKKGKKKEKEEKKKIGRKSTKLFKFLEIHPALLWAVFDWLLYN